MMNNIKIDPYATLGISQNATQSEIRKAYQKLALKYHPDRRGGEHNGCGDENGNVESSAEEKMAEINEAYSILKDEEQRKKYDYLLKYGGISCNADTGRPARGDMQQQGDDRSRFSATGIGRRSSSQRQQQWQESNYNTTSRYRQPSYDNQYYYDRSHFNDPLSSTFGSGYANNIRRTTGGGVVGNSSNSGNGGSTGASFTFTSTSNKFNAATGEKIFQRKTTSFYNGKKHTHIESTIFKHDGTTEQNVTSHYEENASVFGHLFKSMLGISSSNDEPTPSSSSVNNTSMKSRNRPWLENVSSQFKRCIGC